MGFVWLKYSDLTTECINCNILEYKAVRNQKDVSIFSLDIKNEIFFLHLLFGWFKELQKYVYTVSYVVMARSTHINGRGKKIKVG